MEACDALSLDANAQVRQGAAELREILALIVRCFTSGQVAAMRRAGQGACPSCGGGPVTTQTQVGRSTGSVPMKVTAGVAVMLAEADGLAPHVSYTCWKTTSNVPAPLKVRDSLALTESVRWALVALVTTRCTLTRSVPNSAPSTNPASAMVISALGYFCWGAVVLPEPGAFVGVRVGRIATADGVGASAEGVTVGAGCNVAGTVETAGGGYSSGACTDTNDASRHSTGSDTARSR